MSFFIPNRFLEFEYFGTGETVDKNEEADRYRDVSDFAFFAVNFGYSRKDYNNLTPTEKAFIMKAYENKVIDVTTFIRDSVLNAVNNAFRGKHRRLIELWKKKPKKVNREEIDNVLDIIKKNQEIEGDEWIKLIYQKKGSDTDG